MKYLMALVCLIALALIGGCDRTEKLRAEKANIEDKLPDGCTFSYVGKYEYDPIYVTHCKAYDVTTTSYTNTAHKYDTNHASITINDSPSMSDDEKMKIIIKLLSELQKK